MTFLISECMLSIYPTTLTVWLVMIVPATSEAHRGVPVLLGRLFPMLSVCPWSDLTPLFGTVLSLGGRFGGGVCQIHSLSGFGTGTGWGWGWGWGWFLDGVVLLSRGTGCGDGMGVLLGEPAGVFLVGEMGVILGGRTRVILGDGTGVAHGGGFLLGVVDLGPLWMHLAVLVC